MKYRLSRIWCGLLFVALPLIMMIALVVFLKGEAPFGVVAMTVLILGSLWFRFVTVPFEFELRADGLISFRSITGTFCVSAKDIVEIDARLWNGGIIYFHCILRKVVLLRSMAGMKDLIEFIQSRNSSTTLKGGI
jgi:hypothetical protein